VFEIIGMAFVLDVESLSFSGIRLLFSVHTST
jgi:hypothetical protein